jgi:hypothetical protein
VRFRFIPRRISAILRGRPKLQLIAVFLRLTRPDNLAAEEKIKRIKRHSSQPARKLQQQTAQPD